MHARMQPTNHPTNQAPMHPSIHPSIDPNVYPRGSRPGLRRGRRGPGGCTCSIIYHVDSIVSFATNEPAVKFYSTNAPQL